MPKTSVSALHGLMTDHSIPRRKKTFPPAGWRLRPFTSADSGNRELALAYAQTAYPTGNQLQSQEAQRLLSQIPKPDAPVLFWLGWFAEKRGEQQNALSLYESALRRYSLAIRNPPSGETSRLHLLRSKLLALNGLSESP
jgi:hypothetical protein